MRIAILLASLSFALSSVAMASPYGAARGQNAPTMEVEEEYRADDGTVVTRTVQKAAPADRYGNAAGNQYDLVVDGAFNELLSPLVVGSAGNLVTAVYDHDGKRAVLDGGFTRLYINWDTAGTARYVKNAASWLANHERFGDDVLAANRKDKQ